MNCRPQLSDQYDSLYTRQSDIAAEVQYYCEHFRNKTVLCNCDDPFESGFSQYFIRNFNRLELKKLITIAHRSSPLTDRLLTLPDYAVKEQYSSYSLEISQVPDLPETAADQDFLSAIMQSGCNRLQLHSYGGDFQSYDSMRKLMKADIVVTHPPGSMLQDYLEQLLFFRKKFLIVANVEFLANSTMKDMIAARQFWYGVNLNSSQWNFIFYPDSPATGNAATITLAGCRWITNLQHMYSDNSALLGF